MFDKRRAPVGHLVDLHPFTACTRRELEQIAGTSDLVDLERGHVLTREGKRGQECFVVCDGEASVRVRGKEIARVARGDVVGEMSIIDGSPRSATVVAVTPMRVVIFSRPAFQGMLATHPTVASAVLKTLSARVRDLLIA